MALTDPPTVNKESKLPTDISECPSEAVSTGMKVRRVCSTKALQKAIAQIVTTGFHTLPMLSRRVPKKS